MKIKGLDIIKLLLTSTLIVSLVAVKSNLEHTLHDCSALIFFIIFTLGLFTLAILEYIFEKIKTAYLTDRILNKKNYIYGKWLNYSLDKNTEGIYNFALIDIEKEDGKISLVGETFRAFRTGDNGNFYTRHEGHFFSTLTQFNSENSMLGFNYTIDDSEKVRQLEQKIFGNAEYFFQKGNGIPNSYSGEFSAINPRIYCKVLGFRIQSNIDSIPGNYNNVIEIALRNKWLNINDIPLEAGVTKNNEI